MKVAILASLLKPISGESIGGTEIFTHLLTEGLVDKGLDLSLFATSDSKTRAKLISICSSKQTNGIYEGDLEVRIPFQILQASNVIQRCKEFDIIHNNYYHFYLLSGFSAFADCPIVTTMHNHHWKSPNLKSILEKTQRKGKDIVVFASHASKKLSDNLFDSVVIPHGIDVSVFPFSTGPEDYILWYGRMVPPKGIKDAIDASRVGGFPLIVAGGDPVRSDHKTYYAEHIKPNFSESVKNAGASTEAEKISLYKNARALLFPTHLEEEFGLVMVEAMACGTPVIAYNRGAVPEVVKDGVSGFIIDPDNEDRPGKGSWVIKKQGIDGLVEAVKRVWEINRIDCRNHVEKYFSREKMINEYISLYTRLLSKQPSNNAS